MDKKIYFEPESELIELGMIQAILTGSSDENEIPQGGGEGEETPGGW